MLHPFSIVSFGEIIASMSTSRLFSIFSRINCHLGLNKQVFKFHGLNEISVPHIASVRNLDIVIHLRDLMNLGASLLQNVLSPEHGSMPLHGFLKGRSDFCSGVLAFGIAKLVEFGDGFLSGVGSEVALRLARSEHFFSCLSCTAAEDDEVEEGVGAEAVGSVD